MTPHISFEFEKYKFAFLPTILWEGTEYVEETGRTYPASVFSLVFTMFSINIVFFKNEVPRRFK